jgi:xylulokinase
VFLGIDIGTSAVKVIIADERQEVVASATVEHPTRRPQRGYSEQWPDDWIGAVRNCLRQLHSTRRDLLAAIRAIGLSGQMHSPVLLDSDHKPLRTAILWNDSRGADECAEIAQSVPDVGRLTGVMPMPGFSAAKILWIRKNEPEVFGRIAHILLAKDYVRYWLTGEIASDVSDAAGTQLLDEERRRWAPAMLEAVGLTSRQMPRLHEGTEVAGTLTRGIAAEFGLRPGLPVAAGGGDAGTGALSIGCIETGQGYISLGTAAVFVVAQGRYRPAPELMLHGFAHSIPDRWFQMAGMLNGASCLAWALRLVGESDASAILSDVSRRYRQPSRVIFLPYLTGERTPHNNPEARGVLFGLDPDTDKLDLVQSVLEGVAYSLREADECLDAAGSHCDEPGFIGGGARSELWAKIIATVLGRPIVKFGGDGAFGPALGAARLAIVAATGDPITDVAFAPQNRETVLPNAGLIEAYAERYQKFRSLYRSVRQLF